MIQDDFVVLSWMFRLIGASLVLFVLVRWIIVGTQYFLKWWSGVCKVRCPQCDGTGMCLNDDGTLNYNESKPPH